MTTVPAFGERALRRGAAIIDHRLARRHLINEFRRGRLRQDQVCDAHPELIRAARNIGATASVACPICQQDALKIVTYVFGPRLPSHGKVVSTAAEIDKLHDRPDDLMAYVVEACVECSWHHLLRALPVGQGRARRTG